MVYKHERHGVRTGNSFKRWNTKHYRLYQRQAILVRSHISQAGNDIEEIVQFNKTSAFGEGNAITDGVPYSLNKQMRWELPGILKDIILNTDSTESDYAIQLIERDKFKHSATCFKVCSTEGVYRGGDRNENYKSKTSYSGRYFQANSVLNRAPVKKKNRRRGRRQQTGENEEENEQLPETHKLRYEFLYPGPVSSFQTHNAKLTDMDINDPFRWTGYQDNRKRSNKRGRMESYIKESLLCMDDSFDDSEEEDSVHEADDSEHDVIDFTVTLNDVLKHATLASNLTSGRVRHSSNASSSSDSDDMSSAKGRVIYVEREENQENDGDLEMNEFVVTTRKSTTELYPVRVMIPNDDITVQSLRQKFGGNFIECDCFPRKFLLNISPQVSRMNMFESFSKADLVNVQACLVFVHDVDNEINNLKEDVYKVSLNTNFSEELKSVQIETIFEYMETNINEIIERTLFFIETLPPEAIVFQNNRAVHTASAKASTVDICANWSTRSYLPSNTFLFDSFISRIPTVQEAEEMGFDLVSRFESCVDDGADNVVSPKDHFCCICYTTFGENISGTALITCGHWCCDGCWKEYIETKINSTTLCIRCPEFDCNNAVDPGTILSLVCLREVLKFAKRCHDTEVEQHTSTKWCPNTKCGRVLKRNCDDAKNLRCDCGLKICFDCLEEAHWPASCDSVKLYHQKMRENGDINYEPPEIRKSIIVRGKNCPKCHKFIEKNGGCPSMMCICGANFCWGCGQLWHTRVHDSECYKFGYKDYHGTYKREFPPVDPFKRKGGKKWYKMALSHRINQHEARIRTLKSRVKPFSIKIQAYMIKTESNGEKLDLDFDVPNKSFQREIDRTTSMVRNTIELYAEINHVVENTSVLINSDQLPVDSRRVLNAICLRLSSFSDVLYELFRNYDQIPANLLFNRLKEVRVHSRQTFKCLVRWIKHVKLSQS